MPSVAGSTPCSAPRRRARRTGRHETGGEPPWDLHHVGQSARRHHVCGRPVPPDQNCRMTGITRPACLRRTGGRQGDHGPRPSPDQWVSDGQPREPSEVPVGGPQFAHAVESAQRRHPGIVDLWARNPPLLHEGSQRWPIALRLRQQGQTRGFLPGLDLVHGRRQWGGRRVDAWMGHDGQELVQAGPWDGQERATFSQLREACVGRIVPRNWLRVLSIGLTSYNI